MSTIHLSNYGISITPGKMDAVNREIQQKIQIGEPFELDFDGVEGLDTRAAYALLEPLRKHYGKDYRKYVSFSNVAPMVNNALIFSGTTSPNTVISNPRTPKHSFTSAFSRIFATILLLLTLGVGQMWATYYYRGNENNWGDAIAMTASSDGLYEYYSAKSFSNNGNKNNNFKVSISTSTYDYNNGYIARGFNGTDISNESGDKSINGGWDGDNICVYCTSNFYIIVYYPNTVINQTSNPKVCASTTLPSNTNANTTLYIKHRWGSSTDDSKWAWKTMSASGANTYEYTYIGQYGEAGCNVNTSESDGNFINQSSITNYNSFSAPNEVVFTYNIKTNALTITESKYTVTLTGATAASVVAGYKTKPTITATNITGYHFDNWSVTGGASVTNSGSASTTVAASATGTATANFAANTYTVEYDANDDQYTGTATGSTDNSSHTYGVAKKLTANGFARAGYSFAGWATTPTGIVAYSDQESVTNLSPTNGATVTLYAKWSQEPRATLSVSDDTPNVGQAITFTGGGENCTPTAYQFFVDNVSKQSGATSTYSYTPSSTSTFAVKVTVTHAGGTVTSDVMNITPNTPSVALVSSSYAETKNTELTLTATPTNVQSGQTYQYYYSTNSGSTWTAIGSSTSSNTCAFTPTTAGTYKFKVVMTYYGSTYTGIAGTDAVIRETYTLKLKNSNGWVTNIHVWNTSDESHPKQSYPGEDLATYGDPHGQWFTYIFDSKYNRCKVNSGDGNGVEFNVTADACMDIGWSGSAWTATSTTCPSEPEVTLTTTVRQNQITLKGQITDYGNDGSSASDMEEVGFYVGATKHTAVCDDGGYFYKTVTGLTANTQYSIYAFATNAGGTGVSATATPTTLATTATHKLKVQVPNSVVPYVYTYCDNDACGSNSLQNAAFPGQAATRIIDGVSNDWYEFDIHDQYDKFIISADDKGAKQTANKSNSRTDICRWYNNSPENQEDRYGTTDCPVTETSLYIGDKDAAAASHTYYTMSGTTTMSKTVSLAANHAYEFKVVYNAEYYGIASKTINRDGKTNNVINAGTSSAGAAYIYLNTDFAGDYTITFNESTKAITVTYPTAYVVTYSKSIVGTDNSTTAAPSAAYTTGATAVTSGDLVPNGAGVTFTAAEAGSGYTWKGWYTVENPSADYTANRVETTAEYAATISAATTIYAVYAEDMHTVTVTAGAHGSITTPTPPATTSAGVETSASIVASPADGYRFINWTKASGTGTPIFASAESKSTTVTVTGGDVTIQANFASNWVIGGSAAPFTTGDAWDMNHALSFGNFATDGSGDVVGSVDVELPANTEYEVKVYDHKSGLADGVWWGYTESKQTVDYTHNKGTALGFGEGGLYQNLKIVTAGHGTYCFTWNATDHELTVTMPASYTVTYETLTWKGTNGEVKETSTTGGSLTSVVDNDDLAFTSGKYVVASGSVTFTASPATNYSLEGWYSDAECTTAYVNGEGGATITENTLTLSSLTADKTVYAKFQENMTTVTLAHTGNGHVEIGGVPVPSTTAGVVTTRSITAVPDEGWYFAGWTKTSGTDYSISGDEDDEDDNIITLTGGGAGATSGQTLTANFLPLEKVYFRNWNEDSDEPLWENVYAYFSISYEDNFAKSNSSSDYSGILMTQEGSTNVYWAYVPRGTTRNGDDDIAFSNHNFGTNYKFNGYEAVKCGDYKTGWNMFVPQSSNNETLNETKYYNGYWKHHNVAVGTDAGYRIVRYNGSTYVDPADNGDGSEDHRNFTIGSENTIIYQLRVDRLTDGYQNYMIYNVGGTHYITFGESVQENGYTITNTDCSNIGLSEYNDGSPRFYITPTSEGIYTLIIDMSGDVMRLSVTYPVAVGDYMLVHSYNNGSAKTHYSDIIKSTEVGERHYSMYIDNVSTHSPSLVLKKCTSISAGTPVWSPGNAVSMTGFTTDTKGVYVFDVILSGDDAATLNHIEAYTGNYYIKTDCATGGWTAYTQNVMEKNNATFSATDASTYDYFYCKWVDSGNGGDGGGTNVKCVIANDYCIAVSDTLEGDDILGGEQILPKAANVRFSYNSTTNTLKRTYINGATGWESSFLSLTDAKSTFDGTGTAMIKHFDDAALTYDTLSFVDMNNWIYQRDLKAKPGSRIRLTANYKYNNTDHEQYLIGQTGDLSSSTTVQIIGGETDEFIPMRAIYDFKTNNLIVGYLASDENVTTSRALNADVLIVREDQGDAAQITFGNNVHFTEVDTVYGILELKKSSILDESKSIYERALYWISFPFDVKLGDVFGFGEYGKHWMIQYYDGAARAENGFWAEVETYWKWVMPNERANFTLEANKGYLLGLDLDEMTSTSTVWGNNVQSVSLYFPSSGEVGSITWPLTSSKNVVVQTHECTIERDDRWYKDANWNVIGVPSYANWTKTVVAETAVSQSETLVPHNVPFLYRHNTADNTLVAVASSSVTFKSMQAYVVQYAGTIDWTTNAGPFAAPKRTPEQNGERNLTLHLNGDNETADHTFIRFTHEEGITEGLDMNKDLTKEFKPQANIYSLVPGRVSQVQLAANLLPADYTTTTVEVGVRVAQDGYYTFSMPSTDGLTVVLYDRLTETRTNLLIGTYRAELSAGTTNGRFVLEIGNAQAPTAIQSVGNDANGEQVIKFVQDGQLYILKNGRVFNAEGKAIE